MIKALTESSWPASRLGEAMEALGRRGRWELRSVAVKSPPPKLVAEGTERFGDWVEAAALWLGLEAEPVDAPYPEAERLIAGTGPAVLRLPENPEARFLVLLGGNRRRVFLLTPDLVTVRLALGVIREALCREVEAPHEGPLEEALTKAGVRGRRRQRARESCFRQLLSRTRIGGCWLIRATPASGWGTPAREARLPQLLFLLLGAHVIAHGLWILSWWLLGWMTLQDRLDSAWFSAWLLLLGTLIPFRLLTTFAAGRLSIRTGTVLKRRLLSGAQTIDPEKLRHLGIGQLLGQVIESEVVVSMAVTGAFVGFTALTELVIAGFILGAGVGGRGHVLLFLGSALATLLLGLRYYRRRRQWTEQRLGITSDLGERLVGRQTVVIQESSQQRTEGEDVALERYAEFSRNLDRTAVWLQVLVPRGWFLISLLGLAPAFVTSKYSNGALAVALGGILLAYRAFRNLGEGLERLMAGLIAGQRVKPLWDAARRREPVGEPDFAVPALRAVDQQGKSKPAILSSYHSRLPPPPRAAMKEGPNLETLQALPLTGGGKPFPQQRIPSTPRLSAEGSPLLEVRDLGFCFPDCREPILQGIGLQICPGDRRLLKGPSGSGRSILAALLAGQRVSSTGVIILEGLDRETLGAECWRRRVVLVPQFHENHVLAATFAFNLLMGRGWPPRQADLEEAEEVCRGLGLGPLLERMPSGLDQMVGETGWQLSHGEKSRLYIARALLQKPDLLILDESFDALDPHTLRSIFPLVLERAPTILVIAHP